MEALQVLPVREVSVRLDGPLHGVTNMLRDSHLLEAAERGVAGCRVYSWKGPWVSLGKQQQAERDLLDPGVAPWVYRPTGGKAVLHGHDVTVGIAFPLDFLKPVDGDGAHPLSRSVRTVYRLVSKPLVQALNGCGLRVNLAEDTGFSGRGIRSADCFAHVSPNDIVDVDSGNKACGCALRLTARAVLVQASIPNGPPLIDPAALFDAPQVKFGKLWNSEPFANELAIALNSCAFSWAHT